MTIRVTLIGLSMIGFAFATGYWLRPEPEKHPVAVQAASSVGTATEDLQSKLRLLEQETAQMRLQLAALEAARRAPEPTPSASQSPRTMEPAAASAPPPTDDKVQEVARLRFAHYERVLQREPRDPAWAPRMEGQLLDLGTEMQRTHLPGTRIKHVECRATLCAVQLEHADAQERERLAMLLHVPELPRVSLLKEGSSDDGRLRTVAYLAKDKMPVLTAE